MVYKHSTYRAKNLLYKDKKKEIHFLGIIMNLFQVLISSYKINL